MFRKHSIIHLVIIALLLLIAGLLISDKTFSITPQYKKIVDDTGHRVIPLDWKIYSNPEIGITFRYPADFNIDNERHLPTTDSKGKATYELALSLISWRNQSFHVGTFATGFEGSKPSDIPSKTITMLSGHKINRQVQVFSPTQYIVIGIEKDTPWLVTDPFPKEKVDKTLQLYDTILASFELK
jgi:hypothetical protein